jgi:hypothetical protein
MGMGMVSSFIALEHPVGFANLQGSATVGSGFWVLIFGNVGKRNE